MPEPQKSEEIKPSTILDFFKTAVKESKKDKSKPLTKIVVRRLPPKLTKEQFLEEFTLPAHDYLSFVRGDLALGAHSFSRAYFNCTNIEDTYVFKEKYDDHPVMDDTGKVYYSVVEWAPVQRVPKKNSQKKKIAKPGTIETDPKYLEFLEKLEEEKNNPVNTSEYFLETESPVAKEKITTTPLLEFIKLKRQRKIDIRNENRIKKREAEKERRKKEDETRKEKLQKSREDKDLIIVKFKDKNHRKDDDKTANENKEVKIKENELREAKEEAKISNKERKNDVKTTKTDKIDKQKDDKSEKKEKSSPKTAAFADSKPKEEVGSGDFRPKEEKLRKGNHPLRKSSTPEVNNVNLTKTSELKSKFRYSEQRNRERQVRSQKLDEKNGSTNVEKNEVKETHCETVKEVVKTQPSQETSEGSNDEAGGNGDEAGCHGDEAPAGGRVQSKRKDPRTERRIRNKDRPAMEIYRPGMGKFSKQRLEVKKEEPEGGKNVENKLSSSASDKPSSSPSDKPSSSPSDKPSSSPSDKPSSSPSDKPSSSASDKPSSSPSDKPISSAPDKPCSSPSDKPCSSPCDKPSSSASDKPSSSAPDKPSSSPSDKPSSSPSDKPSSSAPDKPSSSAPDKPSSSPCDKPSSSASDKPSSSPSDKPSSSAPDKPSSSAPDKPSSSPCGKPSSSPSDKPSSSPSDKPSSSSSDKPSSSPSDKPSSSPLDLEDKSEIVEDPVKNTLVTESADT